MSRHHIIFVVVIVALIPISYFLWTHSRESSTHYPDKASASYQNAFDSVQKVILRNGLNYEYPGLADEYGASTIELILAKEFGYRYFVFPCIRTDLNADAGFVDGYTDAVKSKYGDNFLEVAKLRADSIDHKFKSSTADKLKFQGVAKAKLIKSWLNDSIEIAQMDLRWTNQTPFILQLDTAYLRDYAFYEIKDSVIYFTGNFRLGNKNKSILPALAFTVYWKPDSEFPYKDVPYSRFLLNTEDIK